MTPSVWIIDDDKSIRWVLEKALSREGLPWRSFENAIDVQNALENETPAVLVSDVRMPGESGLSLLKKIKAAHPQVPVIVTFGYCFSNPAMRASSSFFRPWPSYMVNVIGSEPSVVLTVSGAAAAVAASGRGASAGRACSSPDSRPAAGRGPGAGQSTLMPASSMTFFHFAASLRISSVTLAGAPPTRVFAATRSDTTEPAWITAVTKPTLRSRALLARSSAALADSRPACTSTRATPDREV